MTPVWNIVNSFSELQRSLASMERVFDVLAMAPDKPDRPHRHAGRTTFIVAHRLSTIRKATMILLLDDGGVTERGTHESLMAAEGVYYRMRCGDDTAV